MTTLTFTAANDGRVQNGSTTYATAAAGGGSFGTSPNTTETDGFVGQSFSTPNYLIHQLFYEFDTSSIPDTATIASVVFSVKGTSGGDNSATDFNVLALGYDWSSGGLTTADWRTPTQLTALTTLATFNTAGFSTNYMDFTSAGAAFNSYVNKTGSTFLMLASDRNAAGTTPTGLENIQVVMADTTGTASDPKLTVTYLVSGEVAAPTYLGKTAFQSGTGSLSVDFSALDVGTRATNDWLIILVESANETIATPTGFTQFSSSPQGQGTAAAIGGIRLGAFYKVSDGTETTVTVADSGNHTCAIGFVARPPSGYTIGIEVETGATPTADGSGNFSFGTLSPTVFSTLLVAAAATDRDATSTTNFASWSHSLTERHDQSVTTALGGGLAFATAELSATGSTGSISAVTTANIALGTIVFALKSVTTTQTLTPTLFSNSQTFYAPTVTPGAVGLTPSLITNSQTFYAPTVAQTQSLSPNLFTNTQTFYAATVTAGLAIISPPLVTNSETFYAATVTPGDVALTPGLFTNTNSFPAVTVTAIYPLTPSLVTNSQSFPAATVTAGPVSLTPSLFTNTNSFFAPTVAIGGTLLPSLFTNSSTIYAPTVVRRTLYSTTVAGVTFDLITEADPDASTGFSYLGFLPRDFPSVGTADCFVFRATFGDCGPIELYMASSNQPNPVDGSYYANSTDAQVDVEKYVPRLGRLPLIYRRNIDHMIGYGGDGTDQTSEVLSAEDAGHFFKIYADRANTRIAQNHLEESFFHEGTHASIQTHGANDALTDDDFDYLASAGWAAAKAADNAYITTYATTADQEDFAESALFAYAMTFHPERFPEPDRTDIANQIPNRIAFFAPIFSPHVINSQTFFAPTVSLTGSTLAPPLLTNSQTFYSPTVAPGAVSLTPSLLTNSSTFYGPTAAATYSLTPSLLANSNSFFAPTVTPGGVTLTPALVSNGQTFYSATVAPGAVALAPALFTNTQTFFGPVVSSGGSLLAPSLVVNSQAFYGPSVTPGAITLAPALLTGSQSFYGPSVAANYGLAAPLLTNTQNFFAPSVAHTDAALSPSLFTNASQFFAPVVQPGPVALTPALAANDNEFFSPAVGFALDVELEAGLFTNVAVFPSPLVRAFRSATVSRPSFGAPTRRPPAISTGRR